MGGGLAGPGGSFFPGDLKGLDAQGLEALASAIRREIIRVVTDNGGHLASSLGAVDLIVALHHVFDAPGDRLVFDVGHQAYAHKIITGRLSAFDGLRLKDGISGFPSRAESPYDPFGTGHSSTSISAALGFAAARDILGSDRKVVAVIGDGALTGGMALEAMNHAGGLNKDLLVILNDNRMSISPNVGAISQFLSMMLTSPEHVHLRERVKSALKSLMPKRGERLIRRFQGAEEALKSFLVSPRTFLAAWGFKYLGPIDGHDMATLVGTLRHISGLPRPVFLHVLTTKGKGHAAAENDPLLFHGLGKTPPKPPPKAPPAGRALGGGTAIAPAPGHGAPQTADEVGPPGDAAAPGNNPTDAFGAFMLRRGREDPKLVAVTAAMSQGTGLSRFFDTFPERSFDVGIAEQHAVTFAAGLAAEGLRPVVAVYSTFLQRAFDQLAHDVDLQGLPVLFAIDRAGLVGEDGPTHHGALDLSYLRLFPRFAVMAPADTQELEAMLSLGLGLDGPSAVRYPRGPLGPRPRGLPMAPLALGKGELAREGNDITIIAIGSMLWPAHQAAEALEAQGISAGVLNPRFILPLDRDLVASEAGKTRRVLTVEENSLTGGLRAAVLEALLESGVKVRKMGSIGIGPEPVRQASQAQQRALLGLDPRGIMERARALMEG
ncbi:MAG: 1-deoxy-D-xylulose-5-phosphate synthase [Deltaproteobacteria bacterium]|jgi:1-deoxy-D-xylulose-5-phosphate synthase|nr:1-deoxy-D-xylulose-5-phosphate synthase [Deltaproteobacteria bacterium]